jgi:hypothetical protein
MFTRPFCFATLILVLAAAPAALLRPAQAGQGEAAANAKARLEAARKVYEAYLDRYKRGEPQPLNAELLYRWSRRWLEAQQELATKKGEKVAAAEAHLTRMRRFEEYLRGMHKSGVAATFDVAGAEFYRLDAERWVARAKAK